MTVRIVRGLYGEHWLSRFCIAARRVFSDNRMMRVFGLGALLLLFVTRLTAQSPPATCSSSSACAQLVTEAIASEQYEQAHDLAWRAVQLGPRNDPALMFLLARAQSVSGRAGDALVMLRRLVERGFRPPDVETSDDFIRVRAHSEWPRLLGVLSGATTPAPVLAPATKAPAAPATTAPTPPPAPTAPASPRTPAVRTDGLSVPASIVAPLALAYDAVSRRFVLADKSSDTLKIVDELSGNVVDLVSRRWSAPFRAAALAIDSRRGDLWVTGIDEFSGKQPQSAIYRLQLVSGRMLQTIASHADLGPARFVDVAVGRSDMFVLDAAGARVLSIAPGSRSLRSRITLKGVEAPTNLTVASDTVLYVSHAKGLVRVDLDARRTTPVKAAKGIDLASLVSIEMQDGALFAIQQLADGTHRAVRITLNPQGTTATAQRVIEAAAASAATIHNGMFYYIASNGNDSAIVVRASPLQ